MGATIVGCQLVTWGELRDQRPDLEAAGRAHFNRFGVGLAFLATVRADGGPRLHPMCPVIDGDHLYAFLVPSPKRRDLHRDERYAMHCYPPDDNEDAFYITGRARVVIDRATRDRVAARFLEERGWTQPPDDFGEQELFVFDIDTCLVTTTTGHGDPHPKHTVLARPRRRLSRGPALGSLDHVGPDARDGRGRTVPVGRRA